MNNQIIKGENSPVTFSFVFTGDFAVNGLNNFNNIRVVLGSETNELSANPDKLKVDSPQDLTLTIGTTTSLDPGKYQPSIFVQSVQFPNWKRLTEVCSFNLEPITVIDPDIEAFDGVDPSVLDGEAYCTIDFADAYHAKRGNTWKGCNFDKQVAIIRATEYLESVYHRRFPGIPTSDTQLLHFPAEDVYDVYGKKWPNTEIPVHVQNAVAELAALVLAGGVLQANVTASTGTSEISEQQRVMGPLKTVTKYATTQRNKSPLYPTAYNHLKKILNGGSGMRVIRN